MARLTDRCRRTYVSQPGPLCPIVLTPWRDGVQPSGRELLPDNRRLPDERLDPRLERMSRVH